MGLQRQYNKLMASRNKLLDAYTEVENLSLEGLKKRMEVLNQQTKQVERELAVIEAQTLSKEQMRESLLTLETFAESLQNSSTELSIAEKQRVVRALIDEIVIYEEKIDIRHCIPMGKDRVKESRNCPLQGKRFLLRLATVLAAFNLL